MEYFEVFFLRLCDRLDSYVTMKRFFIILLLGLSCQLSGYAQSDTLKISGIITDSSTGEQVSFASVHVCDTPIWVHSESYSVLCCHIPFLGSTWEDLTVRD